MSMFPVRVAYLLNRDFHGTVKQWKENPEQLNQEVREILERASLYAAELKAKGVPMDARQEYVNHFIAPTDVPDRVSPDENLYVQVIEWAQEQGEKLARDRNAEGEKQKQTSISRGSQPRHLQDPGQGLPLEQEQRIPRQLPLFRND